MLHKFKEIIKLLHALNNIDVNTLDAELDELKKNLPADLLEAISNESEKRLDLELEKDIECGKISCPAGGDVSDLIPTDWESYLNIDATKVRKVVDSANFIRQLLPKK